MSHAQDQQPPPSSSAPTSHHQEQQQQQPPPPPSQQNQSTAPPVLSSHPPPQPPINSLQQQQQQPSPPNLPPPLQSSPTHQQDQQQQQHPSATHSLHASLPPLVVHRPSGYRPAALLHLPDHLQHVPSTVQPPPTQQHTSSHLQHLHSTTPTDRISSEDHSQPAAPPPSPNRIDINYPPAMSTSHVAAPSSSSSSSAHFTSHVPVSTFISTPGSLSLLTHIKGMLTKEFVMTDMGSCTFIPFFFQRTSFITPFPSRH
ncbi:unnamed protein product [Closterium sp. NIES-65]|nr:unnamed protein product [Closterium sp. NIES-65]